MNEQYQYRHFTQTNGREWSAPGGVFVWRRYDTWCVYRHDGAKLIDQSYTTAQAAIDAYWDTPNAL